MFSLKLHGAVFVVCQYTLTSVTSYSPEFVLFLPPGSLCNHCTRTPLHYSQGIHMMTLTSNFPLECVIMD